LAELNNQLQQTSDRATSSEIEANQLRESLTQLQVEEARLREELQSALLSRDEAVSGSQSLGHVPKQDKLFLMFKHVDLFNC
jgi:hypothetical protein